MDKLKERVLKAKKIKFLRNIIICVILLAIAAEIINTAPGYRKDKFADVINLIINEENKTEDLKHEIYVNENGTVYISEDDVRNLFDSSIYYDEKYNQIITTSETKVASIEIDTKKMTINSSEVNLIDSILRINDILYLPISDMDIVYNISIQYIKNTNRVVIDELNKGIIKATVVEDSNIKFRPRSLSKDVGNVVPGEIVYCFYTTSKGWRQIRTLDGIIGYVKANKLSDDYILRQDMEERGEAQKISLEDYKNKVIKIIGDKGVKSIRLKNVFNIINDNDIEIETDNQNESWLVISNKSAEKETNNLLSDYKTRTDMINIIEKMTITNDFRGVIIDFNNIESSNMFRFLIELTPRFREEGISTALVLNSMNESDYINIVDYIIE